MSSYNYIIMYKTGYIYIYYIYYILYTLYILCVYAIVYIYNCARIYSIVCVCVYIHTYIHTHTHTHTHTHCVCIELWPSRRRNCDFSFSSNFGRWFEQLLETIYLLILLVLLFKI